MTESQTPLATTGNTLKDLLESKQTQLEALVPKHMTADRIIKLALLAVNRSEHLLKCSPASVLKAVIQAAELGLDFSGTMGQAYLVPFGRDCTLIPGYRGLADLARRHSHIEIDAECVFTSDEFRYGRGTNPYIEHNPKGERDDDREITHAYAIARYPSGLVKFDVMTRAQIEKIRTLSKQPNGMLWKQHYHEAARKTVVRRLCKYLPMSPELSKAIELGDNEFELQGPAGVNLSPAERTDNLARRISGDPPESVEEPIIEAVEPDPEPEVSEPMNTEPPEIDQATEHLEQIMFVCTKTTGCTDSIAREAVALFMQRSRFSMKKIADPDYFTSLVLPKAERTKWTDYIVEVQQEATA